MSTVPGFSELGGLYLEHFEAIDAGRRAFAQDLDAVLAAVKLRLQQAGETRLELGEEGLQGRFSLLRDSELRLVLRWAGESARPTFALQGWDELDRALQCLFPEGWDGWSEPTLAKASALLADPVSECCRAWHSARGDVDRFLAAEDTAWRLCGWAVVVHVLERVRRALATGEIEDSELDRDLGAPQWEDEAGGWPCFVQVDSTVAGGSIEWWVGLGMGASDPRAMIWCRPSEEIQEAAGRVLGSKRRKDESVEDWGPLLREVVEQKRSAEEVAEVVATNFLCLVGETNRKLTEEAERARGAGKKKGSGKRA